MADAAACIAYFRVSTDKQGKSGLKAIWEMSDKLARNEYDDRKDND